MRDYKLLNVTIDGKKREELERTLPEYLIDSVNSMTQPFCYIYIFLELL